MENVPFITNGITSALELIKDSLGKEIHIASEELVKAAKASSAMVIHSQPRDTLLKKMMHRSDNFYADQSLLMASQLKLNQIDEAAMINYVLKNDLSQLPVQPTWIDGSGLSRYNQFSPSDMIVVLNQIKSQQDWKVVTSIFPKVGEGTLRSFGNADEEFIYAKTGSMGGVYCLSGYVIHKKGKWLSFSIMVNNHNSNSATVRKKIEAFLQAL
jgi:D-alanyl-D-alanine carboxypeptidase/D-alanyl-D-alanine-endopeptidase (penicillin-binding protein 4)